MKKYNIEEIRGKLERYKDIPLNEIKSEDVDDISTIKISKKKNEYEKILDFVENTKNPYVFKVNGRLVKIEFSNNDRKAEECLTNVLKDLYR